MKNPSTVRANDTPTDDMRILMTSDTCYPDIGGADRSMVGSFRYVRPC